MADTQSQKIPLTFRWSAATAVPVIANHLRQRGFEVNDERVAQRVMMFRKDANRWSEIHTGRTHRARAERSWLRVSGPECDAVPELLNGFCVGGVFEDLDPAEG